MTPEQNLKKCVFNLMGIIFYEDELFSNWNKNPLRTNQVYFALVINSFNLKSIINPWS